MPAIRSRIEDAVFGKGSVLLLRHDCTSRMACVTTLCVQPAVAAQVKGLRWKREAGRRRQCFPTRWPQKGQRNRPRAVSAQGKDTGILRDPPGPKASVVRVFACEGTCGRCRSAASLLWISCRRMFPMRRAAIRADERATLRQVTAQGVDVDLSSQIRQPGLSGQSRRAQSE